MKYLFAYSRSARRHSKEEVWASYLSPVATFLVDSNFRYFFEKVYFIVCIYIYPVDIKICHTASESRGFKLWFEHSLDLFQAHNFWTGGVSRWERVSHIYIFLWKAANFKWDNKGKLDLEYMQRFLPCKKLYNVQRVIFVMVLVGNKKNQQI